MLYDDIRKNGGVPIMWKAGHSLIKGKMKEEGALLAGEMSGHLFFAERYFGYDDAIYAGARLLEILTTEHKELEDLLAGIPTPVSTPEIRMDCPGKRARAWQKSSATWQDIAGVRVIQAFGQEESTQERFNQVNEANRDANINAMSLSFIFLPTIEFLGVLSTAIVLWFGGLMVGRGTL